jgi:5'-3' exonuclease
MKSNELLNQVKTLLGMEVKLEQMKLENGTVLEAEKFEAGNEIFIVTEDERVALPIGEYILENGMVVVIEEEGLIKEVKSMESEEAPEVEVEVEAKEEEKEETAYATKEELAEVKSMIEEIKAMLEPKKEEEVSEVKEELSSQLPKEVLAELSQPAVEPINTNAELQKTEVKFNIASKRPQSTMDRVMGKLNKL